MTAGESLTTAHCSGCYNAAVSIAGPARVVGKVAASTSNVTRCCAPSPSYAAPSTSRPSKPSKVGRCDIAATSSVGLPSQHCCRWQRRRVTVPKSPENAGGDQESSRVAEGSFRQSIRQAEGHPPQGHDGCPGASGGG